MGFQSSRQRPRRQRVCPHVPFHTRTTLSRQLMGTHRFSPILDLALSLCECKYSRLPSLKRARTTAGMPNRFTYKFRLFSGCVDAAWPVAAHCSAQRERVAGSFAAAGAESAQSTVSSPSWKLGCSPQPGLIREQARVQGRTRVQGRARLEGRARIRPAAPPRGTGPETAASGRARNAGPTRRSSRQLPRAPESAEQLPARRFPHSPKPRPKPCPRSSGSEDFADASQSQRRVTDSA